MLSAAQMSGMSAAQQHQFSQFLLQWQQQQQSLSSTSMPLISHAKDQQPSQDQSQFSQPSHEKQVPALGQQLPQSSNGQLPLPSAPATMTGAVQYQSAPRPTPAGSSAASAGLQECDQCEQTPAVSKCDDCDMVYCGECWDEVHSIGKLATHHKLPLPKIVKCCKCTTADATLHCHDCDADFCTACDIAMHRKGRLKTHSRVSLAAEDVSQEASPRKFSGRLCDKCSSSYADVHCADCSLHYCQACDTRMHSKGKRQQHVRVPTTPSAIPDAVKATEPQPSTANVTSRQQQDTTQPCSILSPPPAVAPAASEQSGGSQVSAPRRTTAGVESSNADTSARHPEISSAGNQQQNAPQTEITSSSAAQTSAQSPLTAVKAFGPAAPHQLAVAGSVASPPTTNATASFTVLPLLNVHCDTQDTGTLMQKVLVSDQGVYEVARLSSSSSSSDRNSSTGYDGSGDSRRNNHGMERQRSRDSQHSLAVLKHEHLRKNTVMTVGLYGNKGRIAAWLRERQLVDARSLRKLMDGTDPGIYCLSNGGRVQFLVLRPTDNAFTEMSRKNISCNMVRYLLELCDEIMVFFAESEQSLFNHFPFGSQRVEKRTQKLVVSFQKESDEDIILKDGFCVELKQGPLRSSAEVVLCQSSHVRAVHVGQSVTQVVEFLQPRNHPLLPNAAAEFLREKMSYFQVSFAGYICDENILELCRAAVPELLPVVEEFDTAVKTFKNNLERVQKEQQEKEHEERTELRRHIEQAVKYHVMQTCPIASYFFGEIAILRKAKSSHEAAMCSVCLSIFQDPAELECQHAFCKSCLELHVRANGQNRNGDSWDITCPVCRTPHSVKIDALPPANRALVEIVDLAKEDAHAFETHRSEVENMEKSVAHVESQLGKKRAPSQTSIDVTLSTQRAVLQTMEYAYAVFSIANDQKMIKESQLPYEKRIAGFVTAAGKNGRYHVNAFIDDRCVRSSVTPKVLYPNTMTRREFDEAVEARLKSIRSKPMVSGVPDIFHNAECKKVVENCRARMIRVLESALCVTTSKSMYTGERQIEHKRQQHKVKALADAANKVREYFSNNSRGQLKMVIEGVTLPGKYQRYLQISQKEQRRSAVTHVQQLYTFDPLKEELNKMEEDAGFMPTPRIQQSPANIPLNPSTQSLLKLYYLQTNKMLAIVQTRQQTHIQTDVHLLPPVNNKRSYSLPTTRFSMKRGAVGLVDFDEDTRMVAFHFPGTERIYAYRFDPDWKQWSLRCEIDVKQCKGDATLTQLLFVPGQEKLCLLDEHGQCHIYDAQDKIIKKRTISVELPIERAIASLDGSCLMAFSVKQPQSTKSRLLTQSNPDSTSCTASSSSDAVVEHPVPIPATETESVDAMGTDSLANVDEEVTSIHSGIDSGDELYDSDGDSAAGQCEAGDTEDAEMHSDSDTCDEPSEPEILMHVYSLVNLKPIKTVHLDRDQFPPACIQTMQLMLIGRQMHLIAFNKEHHQLRSLLLDIRSARSVFNMTDLERSMPRAKSSPESPTNAPSNYLDYLYYVYDKFCITDCLSTSRASIRLNCILDIPAERVRQLHPEYSPDTYVKKLFHALESSTHKPTQMLHVTTQNTAFTDSVHLSFADSAAAAAAPASISDWLQRVICLVPIQIARAEQNMLTLFADGMKSDAALSAHTVFDLQESIQLGLYEALLDDWPGPVKVISSMGKQSTGKSYMLNHLTGSLFDISGDRCTDGVWLTLRQGQGCLYVVLDFEGLGSMERTEQEDMFLSVMNAAISGLTVFKTEFRVDQDTRNMLSRFRDGVELIKGDERLLRGWFYINIKDVDKRDIKDLQSHFKRKLEDICKEDENNFLTKMYRGQLAVQTFPTLGNVEFYTELDSIRLHLESIDTPAFKSGREFKEVLKLLMAKIHMQEWSSFDRTSVALKVDRLQRHLQAAIDFGCIRNHNNEDEPLLLASGEAVPDHDLVLESGESVPNYLDSGVELRGSQEKVLIESLLSVFSRVNADRRVCEDVKAWTSGFQSFVHALCERRKKRITEWVNSHVGGYSDDGDVRILQKEVKADLSRLRENLQLCEAKCAHCFYPCLLKKYHESDEHDCLGDHRCHESCTYCDEADEDDSLEGTASTDNAQTPEGNVVVQGLHSDSDMDVAEDGTVCSDAVGNDDAPGPDLQNAVPYSAQQCRDQAGHAGRHDCKVRNHTCGQICHLFGKDNCNRNCVKKIGHERDPNDGEHLCNAVQHLCGASCTLPGCANKCISPYEMTHDRHACRDLACPETCAIDGCNNKCQETNDHFHALTSDGQPAQVNHFCGQEHVCPKECDIEGICFISSERKIEERRFKTSAGDEFTYKSVTDQNGTRKKCCIMIPPNEKEHGGDHRCTPFDVNKIHFCDRRCPSCGYFCTLKYNHDEDLHATDHGNMRLTHVVAAEDVFVVEKRRYGQGDSGEAEMCNFHCKSLGRGHIHLMLCEDNASSSKECTVSEADGKRHETEKYGPDEDIAKDELTHDAFWKAIRFQDPCTPEDRDSFRQCPIRCMADEHQQSTSDDQPTESYCTEKLWHAPLSQADSARFGGAGHVHSSGHHFKCVHAGAGPLHHVLVVDRSGSMGSGDAQPTNHYLQQSHPNRLGAVLDACNQYLVMRHGKSQNDVVSFIAFENGATTIFAGQPLQPDVLFERMRSVRVGGGTDFSPVSKPHQVMNLEGGFFEKSLQDQVED